MVFNIAFLLQRCLKLLENHGACRPIVCQPPYARRPFILFVSACASAAPARHGTRFVSKPYTARGFPTPRRDWPSTCIRSSPTSLTYRRTSLTIEGNALRITTHNSWKSLTIEGRPLLINSWFKTIPYYRTKTFPYYRTKSLTIYGNPLLWKESLPLLSKEILYYIMKSLAIERNPLL